MVAAFGAPISACGTGLSGPGFGARKCECKFGRFNFAGFQIVTFIVGVSSLTILYHHVLTSHADWIFKCNL